MDPAHQGNPRAASVRIESATKSKAQFQRRHDMRIGPQPKYVKSELSHLNRVLIETEPTANIAKICAERRSNRRTRRAMKSNAAVVTTGIITFGAQAADMFNQLTPEQQDAAFRDLAKAVAKKLETSLHGLVVHLDETTIHAHFTLAAYDRSGNPISKTTRPGIMSELQDLTAEIMQRYHPDIERGTRYGDRIAAGADFADTLHKSVRELHRTLPADLDAKRVALVHLAQAETDAAARVDEMRGRVEKLTAKAELTDKEVKRLQAYEKRLADRVGDLEAAQTASEAARAEADRLAAQAHVDRQEQEAKAEKIAAKVNAVTDAVASLNDEISAGTIRRDPHGKIKTASPDRLKPAYPEIQPAVRAAADLVMGMDAARSEIASDKKELEDGRRDLLDGQMQLMTAAAEIQSLRQKLKHALSMVVGWLRRPELADDMRQEGEELLRGAKPLLSTEDPGEDTGPGF